MIMMMMMMMMMQVRAKYKPNYRPPVTKPRPPQKFFNSKIVTARPKTAKPQILTTRPRPVTAKPVAPEIVTSKPRPASPNQIDRAKKKKDKNIKSSKGKNKRKLKESVRSSSSRSSGFVVVSDPERRQRLRSYWMRAG